MESNKTNVSSSGKSSYLLSYRESWVWCIIFAVESLLIIASNSLALSIFLQRKFLVNRTTYLLISLTIGDLFTGITAMIAAVAAYNNVYKNNSTKIGFTVNTGHTFCGTNSILSLTVIATERAYATLWPFRHRTLPARYYFRAIGLPWTVAFLLNVVPVIRDVGRIPALRIVAPIIFVIFNTLSLTVLGISYLTIFIKQTFFNSFPTLNTVKPNKKLAITLAIGTLVCFMTWIPAGLVMYFRIINHGFHTLPPYYMIAADAMSFSNSFLNLVVYTFRMTQVRKELNKLFNKVWNYISSSKWFTKNSVGDAEKKYPDQNSTVIFANRKNEKKERELRQNPTAVVSVRKRASYPRIVKVQEESTAASHRFSV